MIAFQIDAPQRDEFGLWRIAASACLDNPYGLWTSAKHVELLKAYVDAAIDNGLLPAVASSLTLLEVLVVPYRAGNAALAEGYEQLLTRSRGLRLIDIDRTQLRAAAQLRAVHAGLRTPDAIQVSAALARGCSALLTNDRDLPTIPGLRILQLRDFAA